MTERKNLNEELWERQAQEQAQEPRASGTVTSTPDAIYINKRTVKRFGSLGLIGAGILAGALGITALNGGFNPRPLSTEQPSASATASATPTPSEAGASPTPSATPSEAPTPTATPEPTPSQTPENGYVRQPTPEGWTSTKLELLLPDGTALNLDADYRQIRVGESVPLLRGAVVTGDPKVDGIFLADSDAFSGQVTLINKDGAIANPGLGDWGFSVVENFDPAYTDAVIRQQEAQTLAHGCDNGCEVVDLVVYNQDGTLTAYTPGFSVEPTTVPSQNPDNCVCPTPTPEPTICPTPTPEAVCPQDTDDIEHRNSGYNGDKRISPKETKTGNMFIFQGDGSWRLNGTGAWHSSYDSNDSTAQIYVYNGDERTIQWSFEWGGDLQYVVCPTGISQEDFQSLLNRDLSETLARPEINSVKVTYINSDGSTHSDTVR